MTNNLVLKLRKPSRKIVESEMISTSQLEENSVEGSDKSTKRAAAENSKDNGSKRPRRENTPRIDDYNMQSIIDEIFGDDSPLTPINELPIFESCNLSDIQLRPIRPLLVEKKPSFSITLINPFRRKPVTSVAERESLLDDLKLIRQEFLILIRVQAQPTVVAEKIHTRQRKQRPEFKAPSVHLRPLPQTSGDSDDNCSACLGTGELICCESCPRVFHYFCTEEGIYPEGSWYCSYCTAINAPIKHMEYEGIFGRLLDSIRYVNPKMFELPQSITDQFEHVFAHPITGEFMNDTDYEITLGKKQDIARVTRKTNSSFTQNSDLIAEGSSKDTTEEKISQPIYATCFRCCKTDLKISQTSFLKSNSVPQFTSLASNIQCQRSELIQCDYCTLNWHLDCLDPPLTTIPLELRLQNIPTLDIKAHSELKSKLWTSYSPLDPVLHKIPNLPFRKEFSASHMHYFNNCGPDSPFLDQYRFIKIRKKWMCPCHADWEEPPVKPRMKLAVVEVTDAVIGTSKDTALRILEATESKIIPTEPGIHPQLVLRNNGHITVKETQTAIDEKNTNIIYSIPESRIKLGFERKVDPDVPLLDQVSSISLARPLAEKFIEFGNKYDSNVGELFTYEDLEMNHQPIIHGLLEKEQLDKELQDVAYINFSTLRQCC